MPSPLPKLDYGFRRRRRTLQTFDDRKECDYRYFSFTGRNFAQATLNLTAMQKNGNVQYLKDSQTVASFAEIFPGRQLYKVYIGNDAVSLYFVQLL